MPITDLESCIKGYEDDKQNATITKDNFCAGVLDKDACGVSNLNYLPYALLYYTQEKLENIILCQSQPKTK